MKPFRSAAYYNENQHLYIWWKFYPGTPEHSTYSKAIRSPNGALCPRIFCRCGWLIESDVPLEVCTPEILDELVCAAGAHLDEANNPPPPTLAELESWGWFQPEVA